MFLLSTDEAANAMTFVRIQAGASPVMRQEDKIMGNEISTRTRVVSAAILDNDADFERAMSVLRGVSGLRVSRSNSPGKIRITYDVSSFTYGDLISVLKAGELVTCPGWWQRLRIRWFDYLDSNLKDNLAASPAPCCSNPTSITGGAKKR